MADLTGNSREKKSKHQPNQSIIINLWFSIDLRQYALNITRAWNFCIKADLKTSTFHFCPNPLFFSLLGYPLIVFSNENIYVLSLVARFSLFGCYSLSDDLILIWILSFFIHKIILQNYVNLEIMKKRGSSINPDIHHSKVFSSIVSQKYVDRKISRKHEAVFFTDFSLNFF